MRFSSDSRAPKSKDGGECFVRAHNLSVVFPVSLSKDETLRGQFVELLKDPWAWALRKRDALHVLKQVSFVANKGDRIALVGRNGAGKTTLCRCLAGIYRLPKSQLGVSGRVRAIFDSSMALFPELTGRENAKMYAQLLYADQADLRDQLMHSAMEFSGLGKFLDMPFRSYSNGMKTRLSLSIATCLPADIFILDEVFEAADREFQERISKRILGLIEQSGIVFFVSHSEDQIRRVCNKAIWLQNGFIHMYGAVDQVLDSYNQKVDRDLRSYQAGVSLPQVQA